MRVFIEERLRGRVDAKLKEHAELLDEMADAYVARNLAWFLAGCKDAADGVFPSAELLDQSYAKRPVQQVETAQGHFVWEAVALLVWADTLAGDYRDPRLPIPA
jgi:hypothetical protein